MTDTDYQKVLIFKSHGSVLLPVSPKAKELCENHEYKELHLIEKTNRDLKFHRAYFALLRYIYQWLPISFKKAVDEQHFYQWLKHLCGKYEVLFEFKDGTKLVEYKSISFAKMTEPTFRDYVREQLTMIYEYVVQEICQDPGIVIDNIELEFESLLNQIR